VNEGLAGYIAQKTVKLLIKTGKPLKDVRILILGATYKEDVPDLRDSKIEDLVKELSGFGLENISLYEPMLQDRRLFGVVNKKPVGRYDVVVYAVKHRAFAGLDVFKLLERGGILIDVKRLFDKEDVVSKGFAYWGL